jgi:hypothetical protein
MITVDAAAPSNNKNGLTPDGNIAEGYFVPSLGRFFGEKVFPRVRAIARPPHSSGDTPQRPAGSLSMRRSREFFQRSHTLRAASF